MRHVAAILSILALLVSAECADARQYYVSPTGKDSYAGTSPARSWQTLARVSTAALKAGDIVSFEAGGAFSGTLKITRSGKPGRPITYNAYGEGAKPEIRAGYSMGVHILNAEHVALAGLKVTGVGPEAMSMQHDSVGVQIENAFVKERTLAGIRVDDLDVSGFYWAGIQVTASRFVNERRQITRRRGFRDFRFTRLDVHHNGWTGMVVGGCGNSPHFPAVYCHSDLYIGQSQFHDNDGVAEPYHTGDGLYVWDVDGATIEHNAAYRNGKNNQTVAGPVGIWAFWSTRLTIQYNESYENRTANGDGGGFDLDGGVSHSIVQYNTARDNDGYGFFIYQFPDTFRLTHHNVIRYNTTTNDSRAGHMPGAIHIGGDAPLRDIDIHDNAVFISAAGLHPGWRLPAAVTAWGDLAGIRVYDNRLTATDSIPLVRMEAPAGVTFQGNAYVTDGWPFLIEWRGAVVMSLEEFQSLGQEIAP